VSEKLQNFESFFTGKEFVLGYLTLADIVIAEASYYIEKVFPEIFEKHP
jgi:hypothetical protein